ncbi:DDE-type integrase/transposase/recombinase [Bowmanella sp. Y57]|uniref:DDE-type integrase/transposase/recombinase n=1 Tax=Bowmanella yangjiangensis TaxID=2811230 RepID=A0ABS3CRK4_9ALTE|nr:DDE-type integrase/transposase/recombinase [Bowmanella yangjiangensis]
MSDQFSSGRRVRVLNVVDDYSQEMIGQLVSVSISGRQVERFLDQLTEHRGNPNKVVCHNSTEFTSKVYSSGVRKRVSPQALSSLANQQKNAFVESLNSKFRNECLIATRC